MCHDTYIYVYYCCLQCSLSYRVLLGQSPSTYIVKAVTFLGGKEELLMYQQTTHLVASSML